MLAPRMDPSSPHTVTMAKDVMGSSSQPAVVGNASSGAALPSASVGGGDVEGDAALLMQQLQSEGDEMEVLADTIMQQYGNGPQPK